MNKRRMVELALICFFAFLGGVASEHVFIRQAAAAGYGESMENYRDRDGRVRLNIGVTNGQPSANLWGEDGTSRMQLGTYDGSVIPGEKGLPVITLSDNQGHLKMLLRMAPGKNQSPVLVMKDNQQRDRIVMGLSLNDDGEEPFLVYFDKNGGKHAVFGAF